MKERCEKLIKAGANVVITTKAVDDIAAKYFVEAGVFAMRRVDKADLRRIAKSTGATVITTFANPEGEEVFDASWLGSAETVFEEPVGDWDYCFIEVNLWIVSLFLHFIRVSLRLLPAPSSSEVLTI